MSHKLVTNLDYKKGLVESDNESEASFEGECNFAEDTTGYNIEQNESSLPCIEKGLKEIQSEGETICTSENNYKWTKVSFSNENIASNEKRRTSLLGDNCEDILRSEITEKSVFDKLIDNEILEHIVRCTNQQIEKVQQVQQVQQPTTSSCTDIEQHTITKEELNGLLGLLYFTGTRKNNNTKENLRDLWSTDGTGLYLCFGIMNYKRLGFLLHNLRLSNGDEQAKNSDKFEPMRKIWNMFWTNCGQSYKSTGHFAICDRVFRFRECQHTSLQTKNELRFTAMVDLKTYFTCNMEPYYDQQPELNTVNGWLDSFKSNTKHVTVYSDRYENYSAASHFLNKNVTFLGAIKKSQPEIPPLLRTKFKLNKSLSLKGPAIVVESKKEKKEQHIFLVAHQTDISRKPDVIISTTDASTIINEETKKPLILETYNNEKDALNEMQYESCSVSVTTRSLSLAVLFTILDVAGINAHVLYNVANEKKSSTASVSRATFRRNLALSLMTPLMEAKVKQTNTFSEIRGMILNYLITNSHLDIPSEEGKCYLCEVTGTKTKQRCYKCKKFTCQMHGFVTQVICKQCDEFGLGL